MSRIECDHEVIKQETNIMIKSIVDGGNEENQRKNDQESNGSPSKYQKHNLN